MFRHIVIFFIFIFSFPLYNYGTDTIPPTGKITRPLQWSVISSNAVRVKAEAFDSESGIRKVIFYASYKDFNRSRRIKEEIGTDSIPPYETIWECTNILDQCVFNLMLYCQIIDSSGNVYNSENTFAVLD